MCKATTKKIDWSLLGSTEMHSEKKNEQIGAF